MFATFAWLVVALSTPLAFAHYTFPNLVVNGTKSTDWQYVRMTDNHYSNGPVTDVTSQQFRCYESTTATQTSTATVAAGSTIGFVADNTMGHPGYFDIYMAAVSQASSETAGNGAAWFKVWDWAPTWTKTAGLAFASENISQFNFTIPKSLPSGQYLVRAEQIALHVASTAGGAQFYIACAQINVVNGGKGKPGPLVAIPGVYTGSEPGILLNIYNLPSGYAGYTAPGPSKWTG